MNETLSARFTPETQGNAQEMSQPEVDIEFDRIVRTTFGSQVMKVYEGIQDLPVMSGGPTWTGTGQTQDPDDGDTGGAAETDR